MKRRTAAVAIAVAAGSSVVTDASPAAANQHQRGPVLINGGHTLYAWGDEHEVGGNLEHWYNIRTAETFPFPDSACAYQGWLGELHPPNQRLVFTQTSSFHSGCSLGFAFFDWPGWDSNYPENVRIRAKWRSDNTPSGGAWKTIGDLTD